MDIQALAFQYAVFVDGPYGHVAPSTIVRHVMWNMLSAQHRTFALTGALGCLQILKGHEFSSFAQNVRPPSLKVDKLDGA